MASSGWAPTALIVAKSVGVSTPLRGSGIFFFSVSVAVIVVLLMLWGWFLVVVRQPVVKIL